jgi:hypothetical protein
VRQANKSEEKQSPGTAREHEIGSKYLADARGRVRPFPFRFESIFSSRPTTFSTTPVLAIKASIANLSTCFRPAGNRLSDESESVVRPDHVARGATIPVRDDRVAASMISAVTMASAMSTGGGAPSRRSAAIPA